MLGRRLVARRRRFNCYNSISKKDLSIKMLFSDYRSGRRGSTFASPLRRIKHSQSIGEAVFIAMNRFKVVPGSQADFEQGWTTRDTHLRGVPGFINFHLLRYPERVDLTRCTS